MFRTGMPPWGLVVFMTALIALLGLTVLDATLFR
jgi:hypothetical protein